MQLILDLPSKIQWCSVYDASMSSNTNGYAAPRARDIEHTRRARVAPLLAAGMSVRAISAETGISVGAVHRAKRQLIRVLLGFNSDTFTASAMSASPSNSGEAFQCRIKNVNEPQSG